jgi:segregation and condensation protein B
MNNNECNPSDGVSQRSTLVSDSMRGAVEAVLFAYGDPITLEQLSVVFELEKDQIREIMKNLATDLERDDSRGIFIRTLDETYTLSTKPQMKEIIARLFSVRTRPPLTQASYETLAIIAYNQPVTRAQIEAIRGVSSDGIILRLTEKNLIRECGNLEAPGRPVLFETTDQFLKEFGLSSVQELPPMELLMYGTLRDIESSIVNHAHQDKDKQISIDQLSDPKVQPKPLNISEGELPNPLIDQKEIINLSSAFFGNQKE